LKSKKEEEMALALGITQNEEKEKETEEMCRLIGPEKMKKIQEKVRMIYLNFLIYISQNFKNKFRPPECFRIMRRCRQCTISNKLNGNA
jgi:hypothetical protein